LKDYFPPVIRQIFRYGMISAAALFVDAGLLYFFTEAWGMNVLLSATLSFCFGLAVNYFLSIRFVFTGSRFSRSREFFFYAVIGISGLLLNDLIIYLLVLLGAWYMAAKGVSMTGLRQGVVTFFEEMGPDNMFVFKSSGDPNQMRIPEKERKRRPIKPEYAESIRRWCAASIADVGLQLFIPPLLDGRPLTARVPGYESDTVSLVGISPNMFQMSPRDLQAGRVFTPEEDARAMHVAVIGASLADALFPMSNAVDRRSCPAAPSLPWWASSPRPRAASSARTAWTTRSPSRCAPPRPAIRR
jgi:putative flippase GtrA